MSWVAAGVIIGLASAAYGASEGHKAKTTQEHAKKRARFKANELADTAARESSMSREQSRKGRAKRAEGYARNLNIFASSPATMANNARKILTGQ